ncbi:uncharacterized protein DUF4232 [Streptomyces sp. BK022]|uniref:DUF4232 domain-containing protein n=1 Tax=Streptomyces sp. BK022 TaxID=2512123 RepID=UPI0010E1AC78|nr:DUF4232 domain-containing protein [Streptomyces sp. BK022]RZU34982.1 uncharacterized protein DUF4232 [Streptomyces sp. BK022]
MLALLALAGCGTAGPGADADGVRAEALCPSKAPRYGEIPRARPTATADASRPPGTPTPVPSGTGTSRDGVRITRQYAGAIDEEGVCRPSGLTAEFEVTNPAAHDMTYTVLFDAKGYTGASRVVGPVRHGSTVHGRVAMSRSYGDVAGGTSVSLLSVRSIPSAEAPAPGGPCPASGVRVYADAGDAAMGLRMVGLHLENCGKEPYAVDGRPELEIIDAGHERVEGVRIVPSAEVAPLDGTPDVARPLTLRPGERALSGIVWRNTVEAFGGAVDAPYLRVRAKAGAAPVTLTPELDLGTTGRLGVQAWRKQE